MDDRDWRRKGQGTRDDDDDDNFRLINETLGKVWIQLFSLQLWVNSRTD